MTACPTCGHVVERVTFSAATLIDAKVESANRYSVNHGAARFAYAKKRDEWFSQFRATIWLVVVDGEETTATTFQIGDPTKRRRVTFTRCYAGRDREMDRANMIGGMKPVLDAMVRAGLLVDDSPKWLDDRYEQQRVGKGEDGLRVLIEEVG